MSSKNFFFSKNDRYAAIVRYNKPSYRDYHFNENFKIAMRDHCQNLYVDYQIGCGSFCANGAAREEDEVIERR